MAVKQIKAVSPYIHPELLNFKSPAFQGWKQVGGAIAQDHYLWHGVHGFTFRYDVLPAWFKSEKEARLRFVEPISITFDTFLDYALHEVVPMIWDCWPCYYDKMTRWFFKHHTRTAIFTSRSEMEVMKVRCPQVEMIWCPEAVDTSLYSGGKTLKERGIDLLEFGRSNEFVLGRTTTDDSFLSTNTSNCTNTSSLNTEDTKCTENSFRGINHVCTKVGDKFLYTNEELYSAMGDAKVTICFPRSIAQPELAQGVETLTQRYWEAMLSRMVIVGHAPAELVDFIGYNPCIELDITQSVEDRRKQILDVIEHIEDYQGLVDRNREVALNMGGWDTRMSWLRGRLLELGYCS